ncbi:SEL1-like repeat protein, partial [Helicobacter cetorum]
MNDLYACYYLGRMHEFGEVVTKDYSKALKLYKKACSLEDGYVGSACYRL